MSSACPVSLAPLAAETIDRPRPLPLRTLPRNLRGRWNRAGGPFRRASLARLLLPSAVPVRDGGKPLQSIFAAAATRRARTMFGLVLLLEENSWHGREPWYPDASPLTLQRELALGKALAAQFAALDAEGGLDARPCGPILTGILSGFVELFGPGIGQLSFEADIDTLHLAEAGRRALVLAATELIGSAMLYGVRRPHAGTFRAILRHHAEPSAEFILEHEGDAVELLPDRTSFDALSPLAAVLDARLSGRRTATGGSAIVLRFPC